MTKHIRRWVFALVAVAAIVGLSGCSIPGRTQPKGAPDSQEPGHVNTDQFDKLTLECQILSPQQIGKAMGGYAPSPGFNGAICRWTLPGPTTVTFNWFEWGNVAAEQRTAKKMGYETENIKINGSSAVQQTKPGRSICGVTAKAPSRGVYTWFVESPGQTPVDPCTGAKKLMEMVLKTSA